ncbi:iron-containing alcohol dehydrogenase, partial [Alishewanella sp. SMS9]|nr:iron-containing alcohol dehydrogenase [Alishewanella sp. SMS9]
MFNFSYQNSTRILFGQDQIKQLAELITPEQKVLLLYGGGSIKTNGVYQQVTAALQAAEVIEFSGVEPNPNFETLMRATDIVRREKIDLILAV